MSSRRVRLLCVSAVAASAVAGVGVWVGAGPVGAGDCASQEAEDYPHLEQVAHEVTGNLADRTRRYSFCEDSGLPGAAVQVSIYEWRKHSEAHEFLNKVAGVEPRGGGTEAFYLDGVTVHSTVVGDHLENDGKRFVMLTFQEPR
jgi:hypothetical protein